jgi:sigma-B regulation protein RsbU (phosphoserine phosphatase)
MTSLGLIALHQPDAAVTARTKMRRLAMTLGMDDVAATRLSTATSQSVRWLHEHDSPATLDVSLRRSPGGDDLVCTFRTASRVSAPAFLSMFFDRVRQQDDGFEATIRLDVDTADERLVQRARTIVAEQTRDELLEEIRSKNEALEASKEVLERTVQERTEELAVALEQLESSELIIERWAPDGTILAMNRFGLDLLGFDEEEIVGRSALETIVPDDEDVRRNWIESGARLAGDPTRYTESELQCRKKDGTPVWVAFRNKALVDPDGVISEVLSVGLDVTQRRELEAQLQTANERMEGELNIGRDIQMSMLPQHFPAFPDRDDFQIYATLEPAREVGGDLFDYYLTDEDHLCFLVGDVSDKGVPAALFMAVTKTAIKSQAFGNTDAASILTHLNDELAENNESSMFVTAFVALLDTRTGVMSYTNAGHNPPYVKRTDGSLTRLDDRHGPVAGAMEGIAFGSSSMVLEPGDCVILYTDGVTEAMNAEHAQFGDHALEQLLAGAPEGDPETLVSLVNDAVTRHRGAAEQSDDITVLAMNYLGADPEVAHLELVVPAELGAIAVATEEFEAFAREHGLDDTIRRQILLVLDDMLNNVASYAYEGVERQPGEEQSIDVKADLSPTRLVVTISDRGVPFNPFGLNPPNVQESLEERDIGGLGIHLVRAVMDEVDYTRRAGRNVVTLTKRLDVEASGDTDTGGQA